MKNFLGYLAADLINGAFELLFGACLWLNVRAILRDKKIDGVSWVPQTLSITWAVWSLLYYPTLGQWWSFAGSCLIVLINGWWLWLVFYFCCKCAETK